MRAGGATGAVGFTQSALVVYADGGPSSHFGITQNPMNGCLPAQEQHGSWLVAGNSLL